MKTRMLLLLLVCTTFVHAQTVDEALQTTVRQFYAASTQEERLARSNRLSLIANKWNAEWFTHYYSAYAKTLLGVYEQDQTKKISYFEEAEKNLETARATAKGANDEVYALAAMIASMKIGIYPDQWQKYGDQFATNIKKAKDLRKENPRLYYLEGMSKFYTPEAYGGGKKSALPYFQKAAEYFALESDADIRKPSWGKKQNEEMIKKCEE
ncbi:MAG: hypothetical protein HOP30_12695 [Cyclobacteriaceae bacterium]|nr:hypothetical protein [Cyclobacteriaceae bacterium]